MRLYGNKHCRFAALACLMLLLGSCAPGSYRQGRVHFQEREYESAIADYQKALESRSDDYRIHREMGVTYYRMAAMENAVISLKAALGLRSGDGVSLLYLGMAYEALRKYAEAVSIYSQYKKISPIDEVRKQVEARLYHLIRRQIEAEVKAAVRGERILGMTGAGKDDVRTKRIGVIALKNMGSPYFDPLSKGLAEMMITDLAQVGSLDVVERLRIQALFDELSLTPAGLVAADETRAARLLGSDYLVSGSYLETGRGRLRIDAAVLPAEDTAEPEPDRAEGGLAEIFAMEKELVFKIIDKLGIKLTQEERDAIEPVPTENLLAFMAYGRGLEHEDRGDFLSAMTEYTKAAGLDSTFAAAAEKAQRLETVTDYSTDLQELESSYIQSHASGAAREILSLEGHLLHMGDVLQSGLLPGIERRKPATEGRNSTFGNSAGFDIVVPLSSGTSRGGE